MFGLLRPCHSTMGPDRVAEYRAHMCGACLGLRDQAGQVARLALNKDALVLAMLVEHLSKPADRVQAGRCPLRAMRTAEVIDPGSLAARYAGAVSLVLANASLADHAADADRHHRVAKLAQPVASRLQMRALRQFPQLQEDFRRIADCVALEAKARSEPGRDMAAYLEYTELAFGIGFSGVAVLAGRPDLAAALSQMGAAYGRIAALVDALEDFEEDAARGQFNLVRAAYPHLPPTERTTAVREELLAAAAKIGHVLDALEAGPDSTLRYLLTGALRARIDRAMGHLPAPRPHWGLAVATVSILRVWSIDDDCKLECCTEGCGDCCGEGCSEGCGHCH